MADQNVGLPSAPLSPSVPCSSAPPGALASFRPLVDTIGSQGEKDQLTAGVLVSLMPDCGEATAVWHGPPSNGDAESLWATLDPTERELLNAKRSLQRTKSAARRYAVSNLLTKNWTLTWEGDGTFDRSEAIARVNRFLKTLRGELGGPLPYLYVLEVHPKGHGYHVHLLLDDRFIDKHRMQRLWGAIVHFSAHARKHHGGNKAQARIAVGYLLKYLTKDWEAGSGQHRYERSTGFNVVVVRRLFRSFVEARAWLTAQRDGAPLTSSFDSGDIEDWHGPPVVWLAW